MKKKLTVVIDRPLSEVFSFTLNPKNTPRWVEGITEEVVNETPTKLGTIYRNRGENGNWSEYIVSAFDNGKTFTMSQTTKRYHVKYTFKPLSKGRTELTYYEWVDEEGQLEKPFTIAILQKLKEIVEVQ